MNHNSSAKPLMMIYGVVPGLALLLCSCRHLSAPPSTSAGTSSFVFVEPPPVKPRMASTDEPLIEDSFLVEPDYFVEAKPLEPLSMPLYPPKALSGKAGLVTVGVRMMIDAEGQVVDVGPSLLTFSTPSRYSEEFQNAVRTAVMRWRFRPAQRSKARPNPTGAGGPAEELHWENTETYFDLTFTFTSSGTVGSGAAHK